MKNQLSIFFLVFVLGTSMFAQKKGDKVLLKIDGKPVYQSEFKRLFGKNKNLKIDGQEPSLEEDLQLFVDYKLKLIAAKDLQLDTLPEYQKEVTRYRNQLALPYLNDDSLIDSLVEEAYQRSLKEIRASHILIKLGEHDTDTVKAYEKIKDLRTQIVNGADFASMAQKHSEDPSAKKNKGDLGYFSVFRMVYSFENAAYNTAEGEVSEIFRSQFGYHILKVDDVRASEGEVEVAHIMIRDTTATGKQTIDKVLNDVKDGGDFSELAKKYSDDRRSAGNGGKLAKFGRGALPPPFGEVSFSLSKENEYSEPFKTAYGWHIVRFIEKYPVGSFEDSKEELLRKAKRDGRAKTLANPVVVRLKNEYAITVNEEAKLAYKDVQMGVVNDSLNQWLVTIENDTLTQQDFTAYIKNRRDRKPLDVFDAFVDEEILNYYKAHLEETDEEFKYLFQEYKNGLLLFDLMKLKIWDAAQNDSIGLQKYYDEHITDYIKPETFKSIVVSTKNETEAGELQAYLAKTASLDTIQEALVTKEDVLFKTGDFKADDSIFPENVELTPETTNSYKEDDYHVIVKIVSKEPSLQREFKDVKGKVISDYQNQIQEDWLEALRGQHKIKFYKRTVKKLKKEMEIYSEG